ncbi:MAG: two-component sensor histidine kinase, partial [Deltaproteobacteria bacterium]|nr:two-component sensor histidine kinase [Deltaproteobacteria bacterium]
MTELDHNTPETPGDKQAYLAGKLQGLHLKKVWMLSFILTSVIAIGPLIFFALVDYDLSRKSVESEAVLRTSRFTSNTWRSIAFFIDEHKMVLNFIARDNSLADLNDKERLTEIFNNLKKGFSGLVDLGLIDSSGVHIAYIGPYQLKHKDYRNQLWFKETVRQGKYISDVFTGYRKAPHMVIAVKHMLPNGSFFILRASLEHRLNSMLSEINASGIGDSFIINKEGLLQTQSKYFGDIFNKIAMPVPVFSDKTKVIEAKISGEPFFIGYKYIPDTSFILIVVKQKAKLMESWQETRNTLIEYLVMSITVILLWTLGMTAYMVRRIRIADQQRVKSLHMVEYSNKMASIGRLASGIAHEINNPLAIINEKAGLINDMFTFKKEYKENPKLIKTANSIITSVERCARITRRLLNFARHMHGDIQPVNIKKLIREVLGFMEKEAEYRSIEIVLDISDEIPEFKFDRGKLQQILLNLINNAFSAINDEGRLELIAKLKDSDNVSIVCKDNGIGISKDNLKQIFDCFFSTKTSSGGTGLGLSITYNLVQEIGGTIEVQSEEGKG